MKGVPIGRQNSSLRDRWWFMHQGADGSLWVSYDDDTDAQGWTKPLHEVLASGPADARSRVEAWIGQKLDAERAEKP